MCNYGQLLSTCRKQMDRGAGILGRVRADLGVEEVEFDIDYTTLRWKHWCWKCQDTMLVPPGHIAEMARLTLVGNVALTMEAPTGNPLPLRFSVIHTL